MCYYFSKTKCVSMAHEENEVACNPAAENEEAEPGQERIDLLKGPKPAAPDSGGRA